MQRPVWLFSLDTEQFSSPPITTGGLKASFLTRGRTALSTDVQLVHFHAREAISSWVRDHWLGRERARAEAAVEAGSTPVVGFSCYTWNMAEFLELIQELRESCSGLLVVAGGPHVQNAEEFLAHDGIDAIVLGEGELTFPELLDCKDRGEWHGVSGLAFVDDTGRTVRTQGRERIRELDQLPSALDVIDLRDAEGNPLYPRAALETTRGCPFRCAFCEWGTGAIGTKMYQFSLERFRSDVERLIEGGVQDIWLCDSNFGALPEDLEKARILVEVRQRTGRPSTFATSWHKHHNARVQEIVMLMHRNGLLQHYNLALQTLTPMALELSHRKNMRSNQYEPIAKAMAAEGVSIATELIWGLPGDNLHDFESHLDQLAAIFPNINIFGYTLLPGTEFYAKRDEYQIETIPVAGYGRAKGEYVVACHTFPRDEGIEGYYLISAHILLIRGYVTPLTARLIALQKGLSVSSFLRTAQRALCEEFASELTHLDMSDRMVVYENRDQLYIGMLKHEERAFRCLARTLETWLAAQGEVEEGFVAQALRVLAVDRAFCPRVGEGGIIETALDFDAEGAAQYLGRMELPPAECFAAQPRMLRVKHGGGVGTVLLDPDGGSWMRGRLAA
jgi:radical SAM superfamily enzyme YgiQ (UPF0313 family)